MTEQPLRTIGAGFSPWRTERNAPSNTFFSTLVLSEAGAAACLMCCGRGLHALNTELVNQNWEEESISVRVHTAAILSVQKPRLAAVGAAPVWLPVLVA